MAAAPKPAPPSLNPEGPPETSTATPIPIIIEPRPPVTVSSTAAGLALPCNGGYGLKTPTSGPSCGIVSSGNGPRIDLGTSGGSNRCTIGRSWSGQMARSPVLYRKPARSTSSGAAPASPPVGGAFSPPPQPTASPSRATERIVRRTAIALAGGCWRFRFTAPHPIHSSLLLPRPRTFFLARRTLVTIARFAAPAGPQKDLWGHESERLAPPHRSIWRLGPRTCRMP